jgi:hypothetical protein
VVGDNIEAEQSNEMAYSDGGSHPPVHLSRDFYEDICP